MPPKPRFTDGEKVLCFHGPLLYEAKCLGSQFKDRHMKYFIHYNGWNKNWDEWVPDSRVLKYNYVNLEKQKELVKTHMKAKNSKNSKGRSRKVTEKEKESTSTPVVAIEKPSQQKICKKESAPSEPSPQSIDAKKTVKVKTEPSFVDEPEMNVEIKLDISPSLQCWLRDDFDLINHQKKILHLPSRITVDHIIASYVKEKVSDKGLSASMEATIVQIGNRIRDCFNVLLGKSLLYKFERPQYGEMLSEHFNLQMCEIYGAIHLLRMFTILGKMLSSVTESWRVMLTLVSHIDDFIRYIAANPSFFSLDDYVVATPEYHRRALT